MGDLVSEFYVGVSSFSGSFPREIWSIKMRFNNVRWLVQSSEKYPAIQAGEAPAELLSEVETAKLATFRFEKRRRDWLLGRLTAKQLLQKALEEDNDLSVRLDQIEIDNDADGAPFASVVEDDVTGRRRLAWSLSISHSNGAAFSAIHPTGTVGADMESIEEREWNFVRDYFSSPEIRLVEEAPFTDRALLVTAIWSGKEAVLKVLRQGLRLDTRTITCLFNPSQASATNWVPFEIRVDGIDHSCATSSIWSGWWRLWQADVSFVLTLATREE